MADRTAWRICRDNGWWSAFGKKRSRNGKKAGPPVHDDLCAVVDETGRIRHEFTADGPNRLWLTDITEHRTGEGKLYLCAVKDVFANKIVGYSIDSRMKSSLAVRALENAVQMRGDVAGLRDPQRPRQRRRIQLVVATPRDHGGVRWCVVNKQRIGRSDRSSGRPGIRSFNGMSR